jgi:hypothetical protein
MITKSYHDILDDIEKLDSGEKYKLFNKLKSALYPAKPHISQIVGDVSPSSAVTRVAKRNIN